MMTQLPIDKQLDRIRAVLENHSAAVIQAPPGAGKTTRVPLALLDQAWLGEKKILLLEPRRLAAVSCAGHMAGELGERPGQTVGYQIRMEKKVGPKTKIIVVTEGIFTRMIQSDPALENVGLVIFDEFHERNIHSDLGLALVMETLEAFREDLRVLVMSATMDTGSISHLMGNVPVIESKGKSYPVQTFYAAPVNRQNRPIPIEPACADAVQKALSQTDGDILVFLPGVGEIIRLKTLLEDRQIPDIRIIPLYGNLPVKEQRVVFAMAKKGIRKVIIATAIAETSITIDGIKTVIDSGLSRNLQFSPQTGMSRLVTTPVSKASADQRRGRAGRTGPGACFRLWSEYDHSLLKPYSVPEILSTDLASLILELAAWGVTDPADLKWLDLPQPGPVGQARDLLKELGALDTAGRITAHGRKMASAGLHPRLSHMVLTAKKKNKGSLGCRLAALLMERDIVRFDRGEGDPDIRLRLEIVEKVSEGQRGSTPSGTNKKAVKRLLESERKIARDFQVKPDRHDLHDAGELLAHAYPDRVARQRKGKTNHYQTAAGKGAYFSKTNTLAGSEFIVAVHLDGNPKNARVWLAAPYSRKTLERDFKNEVHKESAIVWDEKADEVKQVEYTMFQKMVIEEKTMPVTDQDSAVEMLVQHIKKAGPAALPWSKRHKSLCHRACFLKNTGFYPDLPDLSDHALAKTMTEWLAPFLTGIYSIADLESLDMGSVLSVLLPWDGQRVVDTHAPTHLIVPSGSKKPLVYHDRKGALTSPVLAVRLQEMFGLDETPRVASGKVPVTIHFLSPAGRAVQITQDLKSFWDNTYQEVKKDLLGRYPKHYWPDDPYTATPTSRVRPK